VRLFLIEQLRVKVHEAHPTKMLHKGNQQFERQK